jgi:hypothetical protein
MRENYDIDVAIFRKWFGNADFDPITMTALTVAGGAMSAAGTLAGGAAAAQSGKAQQQAYEFQAQQDENNAAQAFASGQRNSLDSAMKARMAISRSQAVAAGSGVNAGEGSPLTNVGEIAQRGRYQSAMDLFNGQSKQTGLLNEAAGARYSGELAKIGGEEAQEASYFTAAGTLFGSAGGAFKNYKSYGTPYGNYGSGY